MARTFSIVASIVVALVVAVMVASDGASPRSPEAAPSVATTTSTVLSEPSPTTTVAPPATLSPEVRADSPILLVDPATPAIATETALPVPEPIPSNPRAPTPEVVLGTIRIPAIGLEWALGEGMTLTAIDRGPAHWPGTARPGELGNVVIAGHRTTNGAPFRQLHELEPGDEIVFDMGVETHRYAVTETLIVFPEDVWIADQSPEHLVTLFACHPPGSARNRIVVRGELVSSDIATLPTSSR